MGIMALVTSNLILIKRTENMTQWGSEKKVVEITKLKNTSDHGCGYYGFCPKYKEEFPGEHISDGFEKNGGGWCHLIKSENKGIKLPVLKRGEQVDLS